MAAAMEADPAAPPLDIEARPARGAPPRARTRTRVVFRSLLLSALVSDAPRALPCACSASPAPRQAYAALYSGRTRAVRLLFAAERGGAGLELDALRLAADHLKKGEDTLLYTQARTARGSALPRTPATAHACSATRGSVAGACCVCVRERATVRA
jgi:hypothetical protein